jgi:hypothetical protein
MAASLVASDTEFGAVSGSGPFAGPSVVFSF